MGESAKHIIADEVLSEYEMALYDGLSQTRGSKAVNSKALSEALTDVLSSEVNYKGQKATAAEHLAVQVVGRAIKNGNSADLKNLASIIGDIGPAKLEITGSLVDRELEMAALGELDGQDA